MKILELETASFRGLRDGAWSLQDERGEAHPLTLVTGPSGCGLTSMLDAIAFSAARLGAIGGVPDVDAVLRSGATTGRVRTTWLLDEEECSHGGLQENPTEAEVTFRRGGLTAVDADPALMGAMSRYGHQRKLAKVVLFPAHRLTDAASLPFFDFEAEQRRRRLDAHPERFAGVARAVAGLALGAFAGPGSDATFDRIQELFGQLCSTVRLAGVTSSGEPEFLLTGGARLPLSRLSTSERNAFALAGSVVTMGLERSLLLVDSPETGLAPGAAARWIDALRAACPEAQWIVATRDPELVNAVDRRAVIALGRGEA